LRIGLLGEKAASKPAGEALIKIFVFSSGQKKKQPLPLEKQGALQL